MKNYNGILILEPEDTYTSLDANYEPTTSIRGGSEPMFKASMVIAKLYNGNLQCVKSRERDCSSYSQDELKEIVYRCKNRHMENRDLDSRLLLL